MSQLTTQTQGEVLHSLVIHGDLSKMNDQQKVSYYMQFCQSLGLNALTQPFKILKFQGKEILYATKDATEQLRQIHGISVVDLTSEEAGGTYTVTCKVKDKHGKTDISTGVVSIEGLKGENLANAKMKAETKAKRRATLSICGLGMMDESEVSSIEGTVEHVEIKIPSSPAKTLVSDIAFSSAIDRIRKGEKGLIEKLRSQCKLSEIQEQMLLSMEDANIVTA